MLEDTDQEFYINCSGAKKRKKKIKKKEKTDVFLIYNKVLEKFQKDIIELNTNIKTKLKKISTFIIPYGIDEDRVASLLKQHNIASNPVKEITYYEVKILLEQVEEAERKLELMPLEKINYIKSTEGILKKTKELMETPVNINFFFAKSISSNNEKEISELKNSMISISKKYIEIEIEKDYEEEDYCKNCKNTEFIEQDYEYICTMCGITQSKSFNHYSFNDVERVSYSQKYKYKKINHFKDTIRQFQGIQNKYIEEKVIADLKEALEKDKIIDYTRVNPYYKLTKDHLRIYLDHTNHNKYYEDINLIYSHFTGKKCPTINEQLYNKLLEDFEKLVQIFIELSNVKNDKIERTNFLNSQYVLYQLLKKNNYSCTENDFALPKSIKCRVDQEKIYIMLCDKLHWSYFSIL